MSCCDIENVVHALARQEEVVGNMAEEINNIVLEMLSRIRSSQERTETDVADLNVRMSAIEQLGGQIIVHQGQMVTILGTLNQRMDRFDERMDRLDQRMERFDGHLGRIEHRST
jgi:hypothetical protein